MDSIKVAYRNDENDGQVIGGGKEDDDGEDGKISYTIRMEKTHRYATDIIWTKQE